MGVNGGKAMHSLESQGLSTPVVKQRRSQVTSVTAEAGAQPCTALMTPYGESHCRTKPRRQISQLIIEI